MNLKELQLRGLPITGDGLKWLSGANCLYFLVLNDTTVDDAGLQYLRGLPTIEVIYLANTSIGDAGLRHLKSLHRLRWLLLRGTSVTDAGLEHLKEMSSLEAVYVQNTAITEALVMHRLPRVAAWCTGPAVELVFRLHKLPSWRKGTAASVSTRHMEASCGFHTRTYDRVCELNESLHAACSESWITIRVLRV